MKVKYFIILIALLTTPLLAMTKRLDKEDMIVVMNMEDNQVLPRNFRMTTDHLDPSESPPSLIGFDRLRASGSGQFSQKSLQVVLRHIPAEQVIIVDLREESHGYINGHAMSWYANMNLGNLGKSILEILQNEQELLDQAYEQKTIFYVPHEIPDPIPLEVFSAYSESELASAYGVGYFRLPCTDHRRPTDLAVDQFLGMVRGRPEDAWLHFHCSAGKGRTTTYMVMLDIFLNAKEVSFEEILARQKLIGGKDIWHLPPTDSWKYDSMVDRIDFLKEFYSFCQSNRQHRLWSQR